VDFVKQITAQWNWLDEVSEVWELSPRIGLKPKDATSPFVENICAQKWSYF
jgi:hypothetical protein